VSFELPNDLGDALLKRHAFALELVLVRDPLGQLGGSVLTVSCCLATMRK
jgi:hypothetical protein